MNVYIKSGDIVYKYDIFFDKNKMEDLRKRVIKNCSYIVHEKIIASDYKYFYSTQSYEITNLDYKESSEGLKNLYDIEYDKVNYPELVGIIDAFLKYKLVALDKLNDYEIEEPCKYLELKIDNLKKDINNLTSNEKDTRKELENLKNLILEDKLNKNQESTEMYLEELKSLLCAQLTDTINYSNLKLACDFLNIKEPDYYEQINITKINKIAQRKIK